MYLTLFEEQQRDDARKYGVIDGKGIAYPEERPAGFSGPAPRLWTQKCACGHWTTRHSPNGNHACNACDCAEFRGAGERYNYYG